ncbi:SMI1/KNR4 family protein [Chryseobacterium oleae]|uniref:SMI1/KNR4 family protein n=1 Tax=Chryseobacterium oleae TaxID=491207 RepID=UPI001E319299|nr:SMI1/KNR4 family protein [Chryseobacterium oleae]
MSALPEENYFIGPLTEEEMKLCPEFSMANDETIPPVLHWPAEFLQLLQYSNGGGIINGQREFGFFSLQEIRYYYLAYGFVQWAPCFLPIAFNGGGKFYAYDFRDWENLRLVAVSSGDLSDESAVYLGKSLEEVLGKTGNIEDELDLLYPIAEPSEKAKRNVEINQELRALKERKNKGEIELKLYLQIKRKLEEEIKQLQ